MKKFYLSNCLVLLFIFLSEHALCSTKQKDWYYINDDCSIFNRAGQLVKMFDGDLCLFFEDGSYLNKIADKNINYYDKNSKLLWSLPGFFHHLANKTINNENILLIGSEITNNTRFDTLNLINRKNSIVKTIKLVQLETNLNLQKQEILWENERFSNIKYEYSHINSIYEIPKNNSKMPELKEGNFIATERNSNQLFIIDSQFNKIIFKYSIKDFSQSAHDAQVLKNGNIIFFNNKVSNNSYSSIDEINPISNKLIWRYTAKPKNKFYSMICGSVQELPNSNLLITANFLNEGSFVLELNKLKKIVWKKKLNYSLHCQRAKHEDLTNYLLNNIAI